MKSYETIRQEAIDAGLEITEINTRSSNPAKDRGTAIIVKGSGPYSAGAIRRVATGEGKGWRWEARVWHSDTTSAISTYANLRNGALAWVVSYLQHGRRP